MQPVRDVVMTVPAYFGETQRSATLEAAEIAGLDLFGPNARRLLRWLFKNRSAKKTVLVRRLSIWRGTCDVTILEVVSGD